MPEITQYYKQQRLAATAGNVPLSGQDIQQMTQGYREVARAGRALTEFGMNWLKVDEEAKFHDQYNTAKTAALRDFHEYKQSLLTNADTESYEPGLKAVIERIKAGRKFTNKRAENKFGLWLNNEILGQESDVQGHKFSVDSRNYIKNFSLSLKTIKDIGAQAIDPQSYERAKIELMELYGLRPNEKTGKPELIEGWSNPTLDSDEVRTKGYQFALADMDAERQDVANEQFSNNLLDAVIIRDASGNPIVDEKGRPRYDWNRAKDLVNDPSVLKQFGISLKDADSILEDVMSQVNVQKKRDNAVTDQKVRSGFLEDVDSIMTGAKSKDAVLADLEVARFGDYSDPNNPIEPTISQDDYEKIQSSIHAEYQQSYSSAMSQVGQHAKGLLLNPDSLGYIKNAPIRYKIMGDFNQAWHKWIAGKGDKLKISEIYPEGMRLAALHQISDEEAERQEEEMNEMLRQREAKTKMKEILGREPTPVDIRNAKLLKVPPPDFNASVEDRKKQWEAYRAAAAEMEEPKTKKGKRKKLTPQIARRYLDMTGDDLEEAKRLAADDGYYE